MSQKPASLTQEAFCNRVSCVARRTFASWPMVLNTAHSSRTAIVFAGILAVRIPASFVVTAV